MHGGVDETWHEVMAHSERILNSAQDVAYLEFRINEANAVIKSQIESRDEMLRRLEVARRDFADHARPRCVGSEPPRAWRRYLAAVFAYAMSGCATIDVATEVYVAPSAIDALADVESAAYWLNAMCASPVFSVQVTDSERKRDGVAVLRWRDFPCAQGATACRMGLTVRDHAGVLIDIVKNAGFTVIVHELGHSAGLSHHPDPSNFMYFRAPGSGIDSTQIEQLRNAR